MYEATNLLAWPSKLVQVLVISRSLLALALAKDAVVPFFHPRHNFSVYAVVAEQIKVSFRPVAVHPETVLR